MTIYAFNDQYAFDGETINEASEKFKAIHPYSSINSIMPLTGYEGIIEYWTIKHLYEVFNQLIKQGSVKSKRLRRRRSFLRRRRHR